MEGELSEGVEVISSVVQGSVLGGTLFDIFIDDIKKVVRGIDDDEAAFGAEGQSERAPWYHDSAPAGLASDNARIDALLAEDKPRRKRRRPRRRRSRRCRRRAR